MLIQGDCLSVMDDLIREGMHVDAIIILKELQNGRIQG